MGLEGGMSLEGGMGLGGGMSLEGGMGLGGGLLARLGRARSIGCPSDVDFDKEFYLQASLT